MGILKGSPEINKKERDTKRKREIKSGTDGNSRIEIEKENKE